MSPRRRRGAPIARTAMIGGAAYYGGKKSAQGKQRESDQEARLAELEAQQSAGQQPAAAPAAESSMDDKVEQLTKLKGLLDAGVLTQEEFDAQKQKILNS